MGVRREGVHLGAIHLQTAIGGNPEVTALIAAQRIDMVVDERLHAVAGSRIEGADAILDTCQTILLRTHPQTTVGCGGHARHLLAGQCSFIVDDALVASTIPDFSVIIFCNGSDITINQRLELIDIVAIVGQARFLSTYP